METIKVNQKLDFDEAVKVAKSQGMDTVLMVQMLEDGTTEINGWK